jgi:hypothetical protein
MFAMMEQFVLSNIERKRTDQNDTIHLISNIFGVMTIFFVAASTIKEFWKRDVYSRKMIQERKEEVIDFVFHGIGHRFKSEGQDSGTRG